MIIIVKEIQPTKKNMSYAKELVCKKNNLLEKFKVIIYLYIKLMNLLEKALNSIIITRVMKQHQSCM